MGDRDVKGRWVGYEADILRINRIEPELESCHTLDNYIIMCRFYYCLEITIAPEKNTKTS